MGKTNLNVDYLTTNQVAKLLMVSPVTIRQWTQKGRLHALTTPGGHRRFLYHDVERFAHEYGLELPTIKNNQLRILIIETDLKLAKRLQKIITDESPTFNIAISNTGFDAGCKLYSVKPDIIFLDLSMPGLDGLEVCRHLKNNPTTKAIRIIAMNTVANAKDASKIHSAGADANLYKPLDATNVITSIGLSTTTNSGQ